MTSISNPYEGLDEHDDSKEDGFEESNDIEFKCGPCGAGCGIELDNIFNAGICQDGEGCTTQEEDMINSPPGLEEEWKVKVNKKSETLQRTRNRNMRRRESKKENKAIPKWQL